MLSGKGFITNYTPLLRVVSGNLPSVCVKYKLPAVSRVAEALGHEET